MKKAVMVPLLLAGMILSMVSCLPEPGESYYSTPADPVIVRKIDTLTYIFTPLGKFLAPDLSNEENNECLMASYMVYTERKPLAAEAIHVLFSVKQSIAEKKEFMVVEEDTFPFITITPVMYSEFLDGKIFFELTHSMTKDAEIAYQMTWVPTTNGSTDEFDVYFTATQISAGQGSVARYSNFHVFDTKSLIQEYGKEFSSNDKNRYVQLHFYCFKEFDKDHTPQWQFLYSYVNPNNRFGIFSE